eukprot:gnl/TRDRNA2_/TRDRNA2_191210_c0_seq1.p1 gnl/TRDRNA2_/TRDRNA2_191210_c0~~gnl/TRDRNA2_/TRDRNA2_191210_c0_seq1.p1  ORF type:complete len:202 (+),score=17.05 gnl/TRDRNA2_/TRDRNA2_191210_c0_seq1:109-714(+)
MLLPAPMMIQSGPPTPFALWMRPVLITILALLFCAAIARFIVLDLFGGLFLLLSIGIGIWAVWDGMNITWLMCLGIIFFINAIFDGIILALKWWKQMGPVFGAKLPWYTNVINGFLLAGVVLQAIGAGVCYAIYKDRQAYETRDASQIQEVLSPPEGTRRPRGGYGATENADGQRAPQAQAPRPFEGQGHRLGDSDRSERV